MRPASSSGRKRSMPGDDSLSPALACLKSSIDVPFSVASPRPSAGNSLRSGRAGQEPSSVSAAAPPCRMSAYESPPTRHRVVSDHAPKVVPLTQNERRSEDLAGFIDAPVTVRRTASRSNGDAVAIAKPPDRSDIVATATDNMISPSPHLVEQVARADSRTCARSAGGCFKPVGGRARRRQRREAGPERIPAELAREWRSTTSQRHGGFMCAPETSVGRSSP